MAVISTAAPIAVAATEEFDARIDFIQVDLRQCLMQEMDVVPSRPGARLYVARGDDLNVLTLARRDLVHVVRITPSRHAPLAKIGRAFR